jgi:hypothetical protein
LPKFETGAHVRAVCPVGPIRATIGAVVTCAGLSAMVLWGIGSNGFQGLNWIAVLSVLATSSRMVRGAPE